ncbi:unnamed protein product [Linum tenue]|uniref:SAND domain-containing protein n=2 Tax=Linum tenue TaxID=586396 RepID=A0AAV0LZJ0_9ROSI|nr:unnamed protein product [Linum tenue]
MHEVQVDYSEALFLEPQLRAMDGFRRPAADHIQVNCGCTSKRFGDCVGILKVHSSGQFLITCHCNACDSSRAEQFTPYEFEKHARGQQGNGKWKSHIWVAVDGKKVAMWRTELYKYYKHAANGASGCVRRQFHRDEFIPCSSCGKQRRFRLRTKQLCRVYHDALLAKSSWKCADRPYDSRITCGDPEERGSRKKYRGCPRASYCRGCTICSCVGCLICRFVDCGCRNCTDFMQNANP